MSQRLEAMKLIERRAEVEGYVVRPLSAKVLQSSIPEQRGWVDRDAFQSITGRRREPQFRLADELGVADYPCPAGGCRLTDPGFSRRMRDLIAHEGLRLHAVQLLRYGRHFRLSPTAKAVVGRDQQDNRAIASRAAGGDWTVEAADAPGPVALISGKAGSGEKRVAAAITARYGRARRRSAVRVRLKKHGSDAEEMIKTAPADEDLLDRLRI